MLEIPRDENVGVRRRGEGKMHGIARRIGGTRRVIDIEHADIGQLRRLIQEFDAREKPETGETLRLRNLAQLCKNRARRHPTMTA
ncbi:MAG: hypothetical protein DYG93_09505 [Leptolyngbya sp. PLA2]|nr:hypothetical protein [Leptolyngbya sp.]MCE7971880.1 hypothetical protein [Leptolyngbya sp. PL-A2]